MNKKKKINSKKSKKDKKEKIIKIEDSLIDKIEESEKEIEEEKIEEPIREIPIITEARAPVLERIIQREIIENPVPITTGQERNEKRIDYSPTEKTNYGFVNVEPEEKKYETEFVPPVLTRRETSQREMRQEFLNPQTDTWSSKIHEPRLSEIDFIEEERKLPFEEQQKKYKRFKFR
jgi:hypothetical protein